MSAAPHLARLAERFAPPGVSVRVLPVKNRFFGETVTVTGLLTGGDVLSALTPDQVADADEVLLCSVMLRHEGDLFLDDMHIDEFRRRAPLPLHGDRLRRSGVLRRAARPLRRLKEGTPWPSRWWPS